MLIRGALLATTTIVVAVAFPTLPAQKVVEGAHINTVAKVQPFNAGELPQPRKELELLVDQGIPERVFCGSPKQHTWKNIDVHNATLGKELASAYGWTGKDWTSLLELWACESSWRTLASNTLGSGAYGIPQSLPASKMATSGPDYLTNPATQIKWGLNYIARTYGTPSAALNFHYVHNWY